MIPPCPQGLAHSRHSVWVVVKLTVNKNNFAVKIILPNISALPGYAFNYEDFSYWGPHDCEALWVPGPHASAKDLEILPLKDKMPPTLELPQRPGHSPLLHLLSMDWGPVRGVDLKTSGVQRGFRASTKKGNAESEIED